jgi:replicative DNA helicase Mcm
VDTVEETRDRELAQFILGMHRTEKTKRKSVVPPISPEFLKKYISYSNQRVIPRLTGEAAEVIENFYVDLRGSGGGKSVPITARQLEALVRLAEARAKIALRTKVTKEDAERAVRLLEESLRMVASGRDGGIDIDKVVSTMSAAQRTSSEIILQALRDFEDEGISVVSTDALIQRVVSMGLAAETVERDIKKLVAEGFLFYPKGEDQGKIKRA